MIWWLHSQNRIDCSEIWHTGYGLCLLHSEPLLLQQFAFEGGCLVNMILGHVALISVLFDRCHSWCWKNVLHCLHLVGVTRWISCCYHTVDCCQSVSDNEVASWREAIRHVWNSLWFIVVTILAAIYGYPLPDEIYDSLIFATDGILLPTVDPLRQLQTLTGSVLQKNFSRVKITSLHCLVIWVIALIEFVGEQAESI